MKKHLLFLGALALGLSAPHAMAADAADLGKTLTPVGAEKAASHPSRNGFPTRSNGLPDFAKMDVAQRLAYHRERLGLGR